MAPENDIDYSLSRVPDEAKQPFWRILFIRIGAICCVSQLMLGAALGYGLTFWDAFLATMLGSVLLQVVSWALGTAAAREGLSTSLLSRWTGFGKVGSALFGGVVAISMVGWFGVQNAVFGQGMAEIVPFTDFLGTQEILPGIMAGITPEYIFWAIITGLGITLLVVFGIKAIANFATVILTAMCLFLGMEPLRAFLQSLWLAISGFTTGGFAPMSQSVMYYHWFPLEIVLMLLMLLGSINFVLHSEMWKGHVEVFFRDLEIRTMVLWLAVMTCVLAASLSASPEFSSLPAMLRRGLFMVISAFSTTGFQNITTNELTTALSSGAFFVLAILMAVGGSGGSTSGGLKFSRMGIIMKSIIATIKEALAPDSARVVVSYNHVGRRILSPEVVKEAMTVFVLYVATYAVGTLVGIAHGYEAPQAVFESVAMASNGGVSSGLAAPGMSPSLELFYIAQMWAGRLEFVTLLALVAEIIVSLNPKRRVLKS